MIIRPYVVIIYFSRPCRDVPWRVSTMSVDRYSMKKNGRDRTGHALWLMQNVELRMQNVELRMQNDGDRILNS